MTDSFIESGLEWATSIPDACMRLNMSEKDVSRRARLAIEAGALSPTADRTWRGWLGMDGPVHFGRLLPDEPLLEAPETLSVEAEGPALVDRGRKDGAAILARLSALPEDAKLVHVFFAYKDGRQMVNAPAALMRFVQRHAAELPSHVVRLVLGDNAPPATLSGTPETYQALDARVEQIAVRVRELESLVTVLGMEMDAVTEELAGPEFRLAEVFWPAATARDLTRTSVRRILSVARRVPRAAKRFMDALREKEA